MSLQNYFREIFFGNPWVTPEIPALVYLEKGKVVGFLGVIPRPMEFRGRRIRAAVGTQFIVEKETYRGPAAFDLLRRLFRGPQELTFTDGSGESAAQVWTALGARVARLYSFNWIRFLRPYEGARGFLDRSGGAPVRLLKAASGLVAPPIDYLLSKALPALRRPISRYSARLVSAGELLDAIQDAKGREPLRPLYTPGDFQWLMSQAARGTSPGEFRMMTVHSPDGERCGSFVYYAKPRAAAYVLQIGWRRRDNFPEILRALFQDAWDQGASAVKGQAIPQFLTALSEQQCLFRQLDSSVVGYSADPDILNSLLLGDAAISRLDGECWIRFSAESWT
ncbi:MAG: hypothetical protein WBL61_20390 [Bryobacteraceae bacterium]